MTRQSIASLTNEPHVEVSGVFRACNPENKVAKNRTPFQVVRLADVTGQINGYAWPNTYKGHYCPEHNDIIRIVGKTKVCPSNGKVVVDIVDAELVPSMSENPIALLSVCGGVNTEDIEEMIQVVDDISTHALKYFLNQVFSDDAVTNIFVSGKGSANHHHAYKGGLLRHSLECIRMISRFTELPVLEREIGIVAALLHDFVKIKMYYNTPGYSAPMISHDSRTLEMLSEPLRDLEKHWFDGAGLLRMILEYPLTKKDYIYKKVHVPAVVDVVWFADQISTAIDLEKSAFATLPVWKQYTKHANSTYWHPSADNYQQAQAVA